MADETKTDVLKTPEYQKLLKETEKLAKANNKLEKELANKKTALKGKETQITNLKKKVKQGSGMHIRQH